MSKETEEKILSELAAIRAELTTVKSELTTVKSELMTARSELEVLRSAGKLTKPEEPTFEQQYQAYIALSQLLDDDEKESFGKYMDELERRKGIID